MGYYVQLIVFAICWQTLYELIRLVQVAGWFFVAHTDISGVDSPPLNVYFLWECAYLYGCYIRYKDKVTSVV